MSRIFIGFFNFAGMKAKATNTIHTNLKRSSLLLVTSLLILATTSCSGDKGESKDDQFCKCIKVTDELNKYSAELFERQATAEDVEKMKELRERSKKECSRYYQMSGEEMRKKKSACKK